LCREVSIKTADSCWENSHERENCKFLPYISSSIFFSSKFNLCVASWNLFTMRNYMLFYVEIGFLVGHLLVYIVAAWFFCLFTGNNVIHPCWLLLNLINGRVLYKHFLYIKRKINPSSCVINRGEKLFHLCFAWSVYINEYSSFCHPLFAQKSSCKAEL
jgi:hypothetical protein